LFRWTNEVIGKDDPEYRRPAETPGQTIKRARGEVHAYFRQLTDERRTDPQDDLMSALIAGEVDGKPLTDEQLVCYCELLVEAGNETTRNAISGGLLAFSDHRDEWTSCGSSPSCCPTRSRRSCDGPARSATSRVRPPRTTSCAARRSAPASRSRSTSGRRTVMRTCSTIRSRSRWIAPEPHLAFGFGEHFLHGCPSRRVELETIFRHLLARLDSFEVTGTVER